MKEKLRFTFSALIWAVLLLAVYATGQTTTTNNQQTVKKAGLSAASPPLVPVTGGGTIGNLPRWIGTNPDNGFVLGDSVITQTAQGLIGIGTATPTSTLTVNGTIEATGGFKFPDGTTQTTAFDPNKVVRSLNGLRGDLIVAAGTNITVTPSGANTLTVAAPDVLTSVAHNATLSGNGTAASPLGIADGGVGTIQLADNAVTAAKIGPGNVVKALNGLTDEVTLAAGSGITLTPVGNTLTIASTAADPEKNAFQRGVSFLIPQGETSGTATINVPDGKRLVIEYVTIVASPSAFTDLSEGDLGPIVFKTKVNGFTVNHSIQPGNINKNLRTGGTDKQVRIYSDSDVEIEVEKEQEDRVTMFITVSGHLVDLP